MRRSKTIGNLLVIQDETVLEVYLVGGDSLPDQAHLGLVTSSAVEQEVTQELHSKWYDQMKTVQDVVDFINWCQS